MFFAKNTSTHHGVHTPSMTVSYNLRKITLLKNSDGYAEIIDQIFDLAPTYNGLMVTKNKIGSENCFSRYAYCLFSA